MVVAGAPPPTRTIERMETELGWEFIQIYGLTETSPLLTMTRGRAEWDALTPAARAQKLGRAGAPALGVRLNISDQGEVLARSNVVLEGYWEQPEATADALAGGWFHTGDGGTIDDEQLPHDQRPQEGRDHLRRRERQLDRGRGLPLPAPGGRRGVRDRRARREVGRDGEGARRAEARAATRPRPTSSRTAATTSRTSSARRRSSSAPSSPAPRPASCRSSRSARPTGRAGTPGQLTGGT